MDILLVPPVAFLIYLALVAILSGMGRLLAGPEKVTAMKQSTYASGESAPARIAAPGYRPFFVIALFFAILHLGILMLGSSDISQSAPYTAVYLGGLLLALIALILG